MRNDNGWFTDKWMGFWEGDRKLIDSYDYRVKVNDEEHSLHDHCKNTLYKGYECVHYYEIPGLQVQENAFIPLNKKVLVSILTFKNNTPTKKVVTINLCVNVNNKGHAENWHDTQYKTTFEAYSAHVQVSSEKGDVLYGTKKKEGLVVNFYPLSTYNEYESKGEKQRNFTPGAYTAQFELAPGGSREIPFFISGSVTGLNKVLVSFIDSKKMYGTELKKLEEDSAKQAKKYNLKAGELEKLCYWCAKSLRLLKHKDSLFAGLPWFTQYWARDTFWSFKALLCVGEFEYALDVLKFFAERAGKDELLGSIPKKILMNGETNHDSLDATTLFTNALVDYANYSGDVMFLKSNRKLVSALDKWLEKDLRWEEEKNLTWMDTLKRPHAIEVVALHAQACNSMSRILGVLSSEKEEHYSDKFEVVKKSLEEYWLPAKGYYKDSLKSESLTPNQLVPLIYGLLTAENVKSVLQKMVSPDMLSHKGLRTLSKNDSKYFADAYHKGKVWGLTTNWLVTALLKYNDLQKASEILRRIGENVEEHALGCLSETFNAETSQPLDASCQLWSSALILSGVDEELFGVKPELTKNRVIISPCSVKGKVERYDKRIGEVLLDVCLEGKNNEMLIKLFFNQKPDFKVKLVFKEKQPATVEVNGEKSDSHEFSPGLENTVKVVF
jgi:predicted glycogen debranching enzyme